MRGKISFRIIHDDDRQFLQSVYADSRAWEFELVQWPESEKTGFLERQFETQDTVYKSTYLGAVYRIIQLDDVDIGRLYVDRQDDQLRIIDLTILRAYQGRGIGSDILKSLINEAAGGKVPVTLHVEKDNPALNMYLRHGFKKTGEQGHHFAMKWSPNLSPKEI